MADSELNRDESPFARRLPEGPRRLLCDLGASTGLAALVPLVALLSIVPGIWLRPQTQPVSVDPVNAEPCEQTLCAERDFTWRSDFREWRVNLAFPESWVYRSIAEDNAAASRASRSRVENDVAYWSAIYDRAAAENWPRIASFAQVFADLARANELDRVETLRMVVSFAQSLPYDVPENYLQLYVPPRLIEQGRGDCDSRALFLYLVLTRLGFHAAVLISPHYAHAMIGVECESCGGERFHGPDGRRYSFIETTARTPPGFLHPAVRQREHWHSVRLCSDDRGCARALQVPDLPSARP